jgi:hypothetical protein
MGSRKILTGALASTGLIDPAGTSTWHADIGRPGLRLQARCGGSSDSQACWRLLRLSVARLSQIEGGDVSTQEVLNPVRDRPGRDAEADRGLR